MYQSLIDSVIAERQLATDFEKEVLLEAERAAKTNATVISDSSRLDLRSEELVTIDDPQASDFDDAVGCEQTADDEFLLTVVIADVAAYVSKDSLLDQTARARANSVYLPGRVFPMLPPILSSDICSLSPHADRAGLACQVLIKAGAIQRYRFARCVMCSKHRLSYEEAEAMIHQQSEAEVQSIPRLDRMATQLRRQRREAGGMVLALSEKQCIVDEQEQAVQVVERHPNRARHLIEEAMIMANRCAADFLIRNKKLALHRIHETPPAENIQRLRAVLQTLNLPFLRLPSGQLKAADFSDLLEAVEIKNKSLLPILLPLVLGTLARAQYAPNETMGHFGLACEKYLHFTSPIRRYPDLLAHRAIIAVLDGGECDYTADELTTIGKHCSEQETQADKASWDCHRKLLCHQALPYQGGVYDGYISTLLKFGFFVHIPDLGIDGMVRFSSMAGYWRFDEKKYHISNNAEQAVLMVGNRLKVRIESINAEKGQVDLSLVNFANAASSLAAG